MEVDLRRRYAGLVRPHGTATHRPSHWNANSMGAWASRSFRAEVCTISHAISHSTSAIHGVSVFQWTLLLSEREHKAPVPGKSSIKSTKSMKSTSEVIEGSVEVKGLALRYWVYGADQPGVPLVPYISTFPNLLLSDSFQSSAVIESIGFYSRISSV